MRRRAKAKKRRAQRKLEKAGVLSKILAQNAAIYRSQGFNPPSDVSRKPIFLPHELSFWNNYEATVRTLSDIKETAFVENRPMVVHFEKVEKIDPSAALVLVSEIYRCKHLRASRQGEIIQGTYPTNETVHRLLSEMGFFTLLELQDAIEPIDPADRDLNEPLYWKFESAKNVDTQFIDWFVSLVEKYVIPMNEIARRRLIAAMVEAMQNTLDHAYREPTRYQSMNDRWFLSMSLSPNNHEVRILLYDQGVGIPQTMNRDTFEIITSAVKDFFVPRGFRASDGEMIKIATHMFRTRTGQSGRGRGFGNMKDFVDKSSDGELRILSNRGRYTYINGIEEYGDESMSAGGTVIEFRFRSEEAVHMEDD